MNIKLLVSVAAIALVSGLVSASADELYAADTTVDPGTPYAALNGIATDRMSAQEMASTRGSGLISVTAFSEEIVNINVPLPPQVIGGEIVIEVPAGVSGL